MSKKLCPLLMLLFISAGLCGCSDNSIERQLVQMMENQVEIPQIDNAIINGRDTTMTVTNQALAKMVVFYDSTVCSSCKISSLWQWSDVIAMSEATRNKFEPIFIFEPGHSQQKQVKMSLKANCYDWTIFVDSSGEFRKCNEWLPADERFHTFLVDKDNRIILVGNPVGNNSLWELYKNTIRDLVNNDGVMPSEK